MLRQSSYFTSYISIMLAESHEPQIYSLLII
uniref:Uncharacterized protein n=1 Tax=Rhizophora mucronata TaxID=61149 RepID=A0A2P2NUY2_RHIMU